MASSEGGIVGKRVRRTPPAASPAKRTRQGSPRSLEMRPGCSSYFNYPSSKPAFPTSISVLRRLFYLSRSARNPISPSVVSLHENQDLMILSSTGIYLIRFHHSSTRYIHYIFDGCMLTVNQIWTNVPSLQKLSFILRQRRPFRAIRRHG